MGVQMHASQSAGTRRSEEMRNATTVTWRTGMGAQNTVGWNQDTRVCTCLFHHIHVERTRTLACPFVGTESLLGVRWGKRGTVTMGTTFLATVARAHVKWSVGTRALEVMSEAKIYAKLRAEMDCVRERRSATMAMMRLVMAAHQTALWK